MSVLLAATGPALEVPALPLLFYFFYDDIEAVVGVLEGAGVPVIRTGHPPHALGGEVKVLDPDGNTVLLGQRDRAASVASRGRRAHRVRHLAGGRRAGGRAGRRPAGLPGRRPGRRRCPDQAEVKLADSLGDSAWFCLPHAEEILVTVPAAFIASHDDRGIAAFLGGPLVNTPPNLRAHRPAPTTTPQPPKSADPAHRTLPSAPMGGIRLSSPGPRPAPDRRGMS